MPILALGISHRRAPVELLERLAFPAEGLPKAYRWALDDPAIDEAVILSTCNRVEVYGSVPAYHAGFLALKRLLCESRGVSPDELSEPLYSHYEDEAVEHLFAVAAGLDSMVIGEPQILSQVREARRRAAAEEAAGPGLGGLFSAATRAGRRARAETGVGAAPDAFVRAGADQADRALDGLEGKRATVVGAGLMAGLAVKHLRARGVASVLILNRTPERARVLAERTGSGSGDLGGLDAAVASSDVLVSATGAAGTVVSAASIGRAMQGRTAPLFILDLAVPRDVEPAAGSIGAVHLADIEDLREDVATHAAGMAEEIGRARAIVEEEAHRFALRRRAERLAPLIRALRDRGDAVLASEVRRFASELAGLSEEQRAVVEALGRGIISKLLHDPIVRLKELSGPGNDATYARVLAELFGVQPRPE